MNSANDNHYVLRDAGPVVFSIGLVAAAAMFRIETLAAMGAIAVWAALIALRSGARNIRRHLLRLVVLAGVVVGLNALFVSGGRTFHLVAGAGLSSNGALAGAYFALRLVAVYAAALALADGCTAEMLASLVYRVFRRVSRRWASGAAFHVFVAAGSVPWITLELGRIRSSQAQRGAVFGKGLSHRLAASRALLVPMIHAVSRRSLHLAVAAEIRELGSRVPALLAPVRARSGDVAVAIATLAVVVVCAILDR